MSGRRVITEEKLRICDRYGGDADGWARTRDHSEHQLMSDDDWHQIGQLRHRLWLERHERVSAEFVRETERLVTERVAGEDAVRLLRQLT